jgi:hypothetical protein
VRSILKTSTKLREPWNDAFFSPDENPDGYKLEDILSSVRRDIIAHAEKIAGDKRPEARQVLANNMHILQKLTECIDLAENSTQILDRSFGQSGDEPRIGAA